MAEPREPSHPPSDPHPVLARASLFLGGEDRPVRIQLVAALLLGLVLVATGLYVWRRPRSADAAASDSVAPSASAAASAVGIVTAAPGPVEPASPSPVSLSDARVLACQDR